MTETKRKASFAIPLLNTLRNVRPKVPRACDVQFAQTGSTTLQEITPPTVIECRLGSPHVVMGFDVETHDWLVDADGKDLDRKGRIGNFGWYTDKPPALMQYARIVELGWALVTADTSSVVWRKSFKVLPENFTIAPRAIKCHNITQEAAQQTGSPLQKVLEEFVTDVTNLIDGTQTFKLAAHNFEFDANIILEELGRCSPSLQATWKGAANKHGYCTMNPEVGKWLMKSCGEETKSVYSKHTKGLPWILKRLLPDRKDLIDKHHTAEADAEATALIFTSLMQRVSRLNKEAVQT